MVDFFFMLSGFIMSHVYGSLFANTVTQPGIRQFVLARFARVYPLHFVMLLYTVVMFSVSAELNIPTTPLMQIENSTYSIFTNLLLLHSMNLHTWLLPAEFSFLRAHASDYAINVAYQFGFLRCLFGFYLGMITYQLFNIKRSSSFLGNGYVMSTAALLLFTSMHFAFPDTGSTQGAGPGLNWLKRNSLSCRNTRNFS